MHEADMSAIDTRASPVLYLKTYCIKCGFECIIVVLTVYWVLVPECPLVDQVARSFLYEDNSFEPHSGAKLWKVRKVRISDAKVSTSSLAEIKLSEGKSRKRRVGNILEAARELNSLLVLKLPKLLYCSPTLQSCSLHIEIF